jgi:elongation factor P
VRLDQKDYQFLFADGDMLNLHGQRHLRADRRAQATSSASRSVPFLQEGMTVTIESYEGEPIGVMLPDTVVMQIVEADPVVKGQTASSSYKPAVLENGSRILVPPHIETGTRVVVNTFDASYVERAKD